MAQTIEVKVPDIGDFRDIPVIEILVQPGARVAAEDGLVSLESDKATMEVPAPAAGIVREVAVRVGDKVSEGSLVLLLEPDPPAAGSAPAAPADAAPAPAARSGVAAPEPAPAPTPTPAPAAPAPVVAGAVPAPPVAPARAHASPSVRRFARELGVDLDQVSGTGPKSRILREDVQGWVKRALAAPAPDAAAGAPPFNLPPMPDIDYSKFGPVETQPLARIRRISGPALHRNWIGIPHVTQFDEADITELEDFRKAHAEEAKRDGVRLTLLAFLVKACTAALARFPEFNASLAASGDALILKKYFHIGVAVDTPGGLVVPVLRDCDRKPVRELARELGELSQAARDGKLKATDMQGGCFSISSLGGIAGTAFTPIINAPEVAILGVSRSSIKPVWRDGQFVPRLMLPLSLSYDHRVIDGALGARFTGHLGALLADIRRLLL
jgi:pyruvate dehydrogenase E2 component (dihydrolipoamide acetyltransferase)